MVLVVSGKDSSEAWELKEINKYQAQSKSPVSVNFPVLFLPEAGPALFRIFTRDEVGPLGTIVVSCNFVADNRPGLRQSCEMI